LEPEARSAVERARRAGRIDQADAQRVRSETLRLLDEIDAIDLDARLARRAGTLAEAHLLRGFDAVHLASFETVAGLDAVLVTADGELARATGSLGYSVALPGA